MFSANDVMNIVAMWVSGVVALILILCIGFSAYLFGINFDLANLTHLWPLMLAIGYDLFLFLIFGDCLHRELTGESVIDTLFLQKPLTPATLPTSEVKVTMPSVSPPRVDCP